MSGRPAWPSVDNAHAMASIGPYVACVMMCEWQAGACLRRSPAVTLGSAGLHLRQVPAVGYAQAASAVARWRHVSPPPSSVVSTCPCCDMRKRQKQGQGSTRERLLEACSTEVAVSISGMVSTHSLGGLQLDLPQCTQLCPPVMVPLNIRSSVTAWSACQLVFRPQQALASAPSTSCKYNKQASQTRPALATCGTGSPGRDSASEHIPKLVQRASMCPGQTKGIIITKLHALTTGGCCHGRGTATCVLLAPFM